MSRTSVSYARLVITILTAILLNCSCSTQESPVKNFSNDVIRPKAATVVEFALQQSTDMILVPVNFDGAEYMFLLDTGSTQNQFDLSLCQDLKSSALSA
jgi:hypothetical protein